MRRLRPLAGEFEQRPDSKTRAAFDLFTGCLPRERGSGDVEVRPFAVAGVLAEKQCSSNGTAVAAPGDVLDVGDIGVESLSVVLEQGHLPEELPGT
jgi:hypothetical protein